MKKELNNRQAEAGNELDKAQAGSANLEQGKKAATSQDRNGLAERRSEQDRSEQAGANRAGFEKKAEQKGFGQKEQQQKNVQSSAQTNSFAKKS